MRSMIPVLFVFAVGCSAEKADADPRHGGQFGQETGSGCRPSTEVALSLDEVSPLGISGQEVLDLAAVDEVDELFYTDGSTTNYQFTVSRTEGLRYIEQAWEGDGSDLQMGGDCPPFLEIGVRVTLDTDDGLFAERWNSVIEADSLDDIRWSADLDGPDGTFDIADFDADPSQYDSMRAMVSATFDSAGSHGLIEGSGEGTTGDAAFQTHIEVGSWPLADQN